MYDPVYELRDEGCPSSPHGRPCTSRLAFRELEGLWSWRSARVQRDTLRRDREPEGNPTTPHVLLQRLAAGTHPPTGARSAVLRVALPNRLRDRDHRHAPARPIPELRRSPGPVRARHLVRSSASALARTPAAGREPASASRHSCRARKVTLMRGAKVRSRGTRGSRFRAPELALELDPTSYASKPANACATAPSTPRRSRTRRLDARRRRPRPTRRDTDDAPRRAIELDVEAPARVPRRGRPLELGTARLGARAPVPACMTCIPLAGGRAPSGRGGSR